MADVSVRAAVPDDAAEIGRIQVDTWRSAYRDVLPGPVLDALSVPVATDRWAAAIEAPPTPHHHVLVALERHWCAGFTALGPADNLQDADPDQEATVELAALIVEPRWGRRGHGSRLLAAAVDHGRADGMARAVAWIPERDTVTRQFLVSAGWAPDGLARALDTGAGEFREIRLHTVLT